MRVTWRGSGLVLQKVWQFRPPLPQASNPIPEVPLTLPHLFPTPQLPFNGTHQCKLGSWGSVFHSDYALSPPGGVPPSQRGDTGALQRGRVM